MERKRILRPTRNESVSFLFSPIMAVPPVPILRLPGQYFVSTLLEINIKTAHNSNNCVIIVLHFPNHHIAIKMSEVPFKKPTLY